MTDQDTGARYLLDGSGGAAHGTQSPQRSDGEGTVWYRFGREDPTLAEALQSTLGLDAVTIESLLAEETRPRCTPHGGGTLVILRGVNFNPGAEPEDMIAIRMWIEASRIVSVQGRRLLAADRLAAAFDRGNGPKDPGDFLVMLTDELTDGMQEAIDDVDTDLDRLEDAQGSEPVPALRAEIAQLRRTVATLRRFIAPQRDALDVLIAEPFSWQTQIQERRLKDIVDRVTRLVEQLDEIQMRAAVLQESLAGEVAERLNRTMMLLSVIAGIFLPLSFVAGVLGMNVSGIPGASSPWAFAVVLLLLAVIAAGVIYLFRKYMLM